MHTIEVRNAELVATITERAAEAGIRNAAIVTLIGGADSFRLSTMAAHDATNRPVTDYDQPGEMNATGEIVDGVVHIHAVLGIDGGHAVAGHLHAAQIRTHFARAYLLQV